MAAKISRPKGKTPILGITPGFRFFQLTHSVKWDTVSTHNFHVAHLAY